MGKIMQLSIWNISKPILGLLIGLLALGSLPLTVEAAGISASGGGKYTVGQTFTVTVKASGAEFDSLQGTVSVSGPVDIVSFSAGSATWLPGKSPANGNQFAGIVSPTSSLTVATLKLKAKSTGSGSVTVGGVKLARNGSYVGSDGSGTSFTISRALTPPGTVTVTSSTHPDSGTAYVAKTVELAWSAPANGATGYSYVWDQTATTTPTTKVNTTANTLTQADQAIGTYYLHIRANNTDGWGATTHFKVNIKEPDPATDSTLAKPTIDLLEKTTDYQTNLDEGTFQGIHLKGTAPAGFTVNLAFSPVISAPEGTVLNPIADEKGVWEIILNFPVKVGFYTLTVQGQSDKILTPTSDRKKFEVSISDQGSVGFITLADAVQSPTPVPTPTPTPEGNQFLRSIVNAVQGVTNSWLIMTTGCVLALCLLGLLLFTLVTRRHHLKLKTDSKDVEPTDDL